jgi:hypothetical protein
MAASVRKAYQRRNSRPAIALAVALVVAVVAIWMIVLSSASQGPSGASCPPPAAVPAGLPPFGTGRPATALDQVTPAPPNLVRIRVLNGGGQRGQANLVASQLGELGLTEAADPGNDPYYPDGDLACRGNIRYGPNGAAAARTVSLVLPCLALVQDDRPDDTVDVAIGTLFGEVNPTRAARNILDQLGGPGENPAPIDPELLAKARSVPC